MKTLIVRLAVFLYALTWACTLGARNPPHYDCKGYIYPRIQCEATFVEPFIPQWSLYMNGYRVEYENGVYVYLTVADQWERAEVCLLDSCVTFYVRWSDKKLQFKEEEE